jgi:hypothetical protein
MQLDDDEEPTEAYIRAVEADDELVAIVYSQSDARLIAAAPDLYAALWAILYADQDNQIDDELFQQAKAAINKAKGEL